MAEKKQTKANEPNEPNEPDVPESTNEQADTEKDGAGVERGPAHGAGGAGSYVVIADQIVTLSGTGKDVKATVHRFGAKVDLDAKQAKKLTEATRPAVVPASAVKDGNVRAAKVGAIRQSLARRNRSKSKR